GRAFDREATLADFAQPQRIVERERVRDPGLIEFRRDHPDVFGQRAADLGADVEPFRVDAVVVGDEDAHGVASPPPLAGKGLPVCAQAWFSITAPARWSSSRPYSSAARPAPRSSRPAAGRSPSPR